MSTPGSFRLLGPPQQVETIAIGRGVRERRRLVRAYGAGRWRKLKGIAQIALANGTVRVAEVHWYEAHGIGRHEFKIKRFLDEA